MMTLINLGYGGLCGVSEIRVKKLMLSADSLCLHLAVSAFYETLKTAIG